MLIQLNNLKDEQDNPMILLRKKKPLVISVIFIALLVFFYTNIIVNVTPSMPIGIYLKGSKSITKGNIFLVCLTDTYSKIGLQRHYLISGGHICREMEPLIKRIIAVPGDHVVLSDDYIIVNNVKYPYPTSYSDSLNRPLSVYPRGDYPNTTGYWLLGDHDIKSWDSRYWGLVVAGQIKNRLIPIITW